MTDRTYYAPQGGLPPQTVLLTDRAVFTGAYAVIPKGVLRDITVSYFPFWEKARAWVLSRPLSGFAETFSQYIMEVAPGGGSDKPEPDLLGRLKAMTENGAGAEERIFVKGDGKASWDQIAKVMSDITGAGFKKAALVTQPQS